MMLMMVAVFSSCAYDGYQVGVQSEYYTPRPTYQYRAPQPTYYYYSTPRPVNHYCAPTRYSPTWGSVDRWHFSYRGTTR